MDSKRFNNMGNSIASMMLRVKHDIAGDDESL